jgi:HEAT repeat protein
MTIDNSVLEALGINLSDKESEALKQHFEETLQERVGLALFDELDDDQVTELTALQDKGDDQAVADWIKQHIPDYEAIIQDEADILIGELAKSADDIMAE